MLTSDQIQQASKVLGAPPGSANTTQGSDPWASYDAKFNASSGPTPNQVQNGPIDVATGKTMDQERANLPSEIKGFGQTLGDALASQTKDYQGAQQSQTKLDDMNVMLGHAIAVGKVQGKDTTKLETLYQQNTGNKFNASDIIPSLNKSAEQIYGEGAGVATDIIGAGEGAGAAEEAATKAPSLAEGALQGLKTGAKIGGAIGGAQGISQGMQQNQNAHDVIGSGLKGAGTGALVGGAGGAVIGGVSTGLSKIAEAKAAETGGGMSQKVSDQITEMARPNLSKAEQASALARGQGESSTFLQGAKISTTARDEARGLAIKDVVDPKADLVTNVNNIREGIKNEANQLQSSLKENNAIFNKNQFQAKLKAIEPDLEVQANPVVAKKYDLAQQKFMSFVDEQPKNLTGLLKARQNFDQWVEQKIPKVFDDPSSVPLNNAMREMRTTANDFIAEKLPNNEASQAFKDSLRKQNLMYEARDNMAEKAVTTEVGKSKLGQTIKNFQKDHPIIAKAARYGGAAVVGHEIIKTAEEL